ncbi:ty1-copia retrotransposon protein [Cucumis melo var. makuwa]|uniref:Ty1-copia retrotransposon protein n=1 Tax=Cucumis melo var. makuwa TaxID=1194695 RepID=A0A5D3DBL5_CUCMM|nr:ty1-copia retrotransposon protein [Cucumis melo var. makuwa]TYK21031.1 ty1-copia retrotransposon protein [Cucumis melo var. makuwa]
MSLLPIRHLILQQSLQHLLIQNHPQYLLIVVDKVKNDQVIDPEKYAKDNKTIRRHLLNHMSDPIIDLFVAQKSAKDIWSTLDS